MSQRALDSDHDEGSVTSAVTLNGTKTKTQRMEDILVASAEGDIG